MNLRPPAPHPRLEAPTWNLDSGSRGAMTRVFSSLEGVSKVSTVSRISVERGSDQGVSGSKGVRPSAAWQALAPTVRSPTVNPKPGSCLRLLHQAQARPDAPSASHPRRCSAAASRLDWLAESDSHSAARARVISSPRRYARSGTPKSPLRIGCIFLRILGTRPRTGVVSDRRWCCGQTRHRVLQSDRFRVRMRRL